MKNDDEKSGLTEEAIEQILHISTEILNKYRHGKKLTEGERNLLDLVNHTNHELVPVEWAHVPLAKLTRNAPHFQEGVINKVITSPKKAKKAFVCCTIEFSKQLPENIAHEITYFDMYISTIVSALWFAGNPVVSVTTIKNTMARQCDKQKILDSLRKMAQTHAVIDTIGEQEAGFIYQRDGHIDEGNLLNTSIHTDIINGQLTESAIIIQGGAFMIQWAINRTVDGVHGQVFTVPIEVLQLPKPMRLTEPNLQLMFYILYRIARYKDEKQTITYNSIYKNCDLFNTERLRRDLPEKLHTLFDYYQQCGLISEPKYLQGKVHFSMPEQPKIETA